MSRITPFIKYRMSLCERSSSTTLSYMLVITIFIIPAKPYTFCQELCFLTTASIKSGFLANASTVYLIKI